MAIIQGDFGRQARKKMVNDGKKKVVPVYRFHISLAFSEPLIWRRIEVPGEINLKQFHEVLRICLGWSENHGHQFYVGKVFYEMSSPIGEEKEYDEAKFNLQTLEEAMKWCFTYLYDAGDGWEHDIVLEETKPPQQGKKYPVLIDGEWASPPEEIGGVHSYTEFIHALENPTDEKSMRVIRFHDQGDFDPESFNRADINSNLKNKVWVV